MTTLKTHRLAWSLALTMTASSVATAAHDEMPATPYVGLTRQQVVAELMATQATHRWDELSARWLPRAPTKPVASERTRDEVRAETAAFMGSNRWNELQGEWLPRITPPRVEGGLTRAEVAASTERYLATHRWDEATQLFTGRSRIAGVN